MAVTLFAGTVTEPTASVSSATPALPAGLADGDYTFLFCSLVAATGTITGPVGWTEAVPSTRGVANTSHSFAVFYKKWVSGDANPVVGCTSGRLTVVPVRVVGADLTTPIGSIAVNNMTATDPNTSVIAPAVTAAAQRLLVSVALARCSTNGAFLTYTAPSGMTTLVQGGSKSTTQSNASAAVFSKVLAAAGDTGAQTAAVTGGTTTGAAGISILFNAAPVQQTLTFEDKTVGTNVVAGGPIESINVGTPTYDTGIHGAVGLRTNGGTTTNCQLRITSNVPPVHSGSLYFRVNTLQASGSVTFVQAQNTSNANHWSLRYSASGQFVFLNGTVVETTSASRIIEAGIAYRFDYQYNYVAAGPTSFSWRLFKGANVEGTVPDLSGTSSLTNSQANPVIKIQYGPLSGTAGAARDVTFDSLRTVEGLSWLPSMGSPPAVPPVGTADFSVIGAQTATGFTVKSRVASTSSVRLVVCTDAAATVVAATVPPAAPDAKGYTTHAATGLSPHTLYYAQLEDTPTGGAATRIGAILRVRTAPTPGAAVGFKFAMGSCMSNDNPDGATFDDLTAWDPDFLLHAGDFHYKSSTSTDPFVHVNQWQEQIDNAGGVKNALANVPIYYCRSDHEAGPDEGDSNNTYTSASIEGMKIVFPMPPLADTRVPTVGTYFSFPYGRIKFIVTDFRNTDRSLGSIDAADPTKTALGATQLAWLKQELLDPAYPVKIILTDPAWIGPAGVTPSKDKWWAYDVERTDIGNFILANNVRTMMFHGDTHCLQADDGTNNPWGRFPVVNGSPFGTVGGGYNTNIMQQRYNTGSTTQARQYQRVTVTDNGGSIVVQAQGWDVSGGGVVRTDLTTTFSTGNFAPGVKLWTGTVETDLHVFWWDGTSEQQVSSSHWEQFMG